jgi:hypothetical protein
MVEIDTLACLDYLMWLQTGDEVAKYFPCHLIAVESHPLFSISRELILEDLRDYSSLALPEGAFLFLKTMQKAWVSGIHHQASIAMTSTSGKAEMRSNEPHL